MFMPESSEAGAAILVFSGSDLDMAFLRAMPQHGERDV
jgi:hypothetical protein